MLRMLCKWCVVEAPRTRTFAHTSKCIYKRDANDISVAAVVVAASYYTLRADVEKANYVNERLRRQIRCWTSA